MWRNSHSLWFGATALLTMLLLSVVLPILYAKHGIMTAVLLGGVLLFGTLLYYLQGIMLSPLKK